MIISKAPRWLKSCGRHSVMIDRASPSAAVLNVTSMMAGPEGLRHAAASANTPNSTHCLATRRRSEAVAFHSASHATAPMIASPKVKLPCKFAHSVINGSICHGGARRSSTAPVRLDTQTTINGSASTCGRAKICGEASTKAASTAINVGTGCHARSRKRSEEHTSELQSHHDIVCRLLLEKKKTILSTLSVTIKNINTEEYILLI